MKQTQFVQEINFEICRMNQTNYKLLQLKKEIKGTKITISNIKGWFKGPIVKTAYCTAQIYNSVGTDDEKNPNTTGNNVLP